MSSVYLARDGYRRRLWMRENAHLWIRQNAARFAPPQAPSELTRAGRGVGVGQGAADPLAGLSLAELTALQDANARLRVLSADVKFELTLRRLARKYSPDQPRVPAGDPDGGQWTSEGGEGITRVRLAAADKPKIGRGAILAILAEVAQQLIKAYRSENGLFDLFGSKVGTVAVTTFNGQEIYGSNSTAPSHRDEDKVEARRLRNVLIEKYPDTMDIDYAGRRPNDVVFHAEANVLMRAARANGGSLAGQSLEVFIDNIMCSSCKTALPYVGLELGNPTVTFVDKSGIVRTMRNGSWQAGGGK